MANEASRRRAQKALKRGDDLLDAFNLDKFNRRRAAHLQRLVKLGYGETPGGVVDYLVSREIDDLTRSGVLPR